MSLPQVDHVGIIVDDLDRSVAWFHRVFGLRPSKIQEMAGVGLKVARLEAENIHIELIQYSGPEESFGKKVMGKKTGLNHISFRVNDLETSLEALEGQGIRAMEGFPRLGSQGPVAFFRPETTEGILLEICEDSGQED